MEVTAPQKSKIIDNTKMESLVSEGIICDGIDENLISAIREECIANKKNDIIEPITDDDEDCESEVSFHDSIEEYKIKVLKETDKLKEQTIDTERLISSYMEYKFQKLWSDDTIVGLDVELININCKFIKKKSTCYTLKIHFTVESKIQIIYTCHRSKSDPIFEKSTSLSTPSSYTQLYSETGLYENKYLFLLSKLTCLLKEDDYIKLKRIVEELFYDYCCFVL